MSTYEQFAYIYDSLMSDIPYNKYAEWVQQYAPVTTSKKLVDIGCGTGVLSNHFAKAGYEVTGVDLSDSMLTVAQNRSFENGTNISFICQSMAELEGVNEVDVAVIAIDSINYLETLEEVEQTFKRLFEALNQVDSYFLMSILFIRWMLYTQMDLLRMKMRKLLIFGIQNQVKKIIQFTTI